GSVAEDEVGNLLDGNKDGTGGDDYVFYFKTDAEPPVVDTIPPGVTDTDPNDNQPNVPVTTRVIRITFNESMDEDKGDVTVDGISTTESWDGNTLVITLMSDLEPDTTYEVRIRNAEDLAGNPLGEYTFTFTTGTEPVTPPPPAVTGFDWLWLLVIILVAIVVILALLLMRKKKPEEVLVAPMAEEEVEAVMPAEEEEPFTEEVLEEEAEVQEEGEFLEDADT
ncbi:MAG: Ig-like domain-containing protein, partial [Thermoplasmata archaeon]